MESDSPRVPALQHIRLYVFSISCDWPRLAATLPPPRSGPVCFLTPHHLFSAERAQMERRCDAPCWFRTFHELLSAADMEYCDAEADREVADRFGRREGRVTEYYTAIKRLKNQRAAERLREEFEVVGGAVLCGDLGIVSEIWCEFGLADRVPACRRARLLLGTRVRRLFCEPVPCHQMEWKGRRWLLIGRPERIGQYLEPGAVGMRPLGLGATWWFHLQLLAVTKLGPAPRWVGPILRILNLPWRICHLQFAQLAATIHEDTFAVARLAEGLGLDYVNLQDSFLPAYYPSRYLLYRPTVRRFYVWDQFSQGIFRRHGLESVLWGAYRSWKLPALDLGTWQPVRRILYLSSGAGDWTALKNRSDEDLALLLLVEVARRRPGITIHYRPHPLWLHPEHQGMNSIERVVHFVQGLALPNLSVSRGAQKDGSAFSLTGNLSAVSTSVAEDIDWADLVMGEHSQTILVAARRGKAIAGINVSKHPPYFGDYAGLGFPLVATAEELLGWLDRMERGADSGFLVEYNAAIERHNRENGRAP